MLYCCFPMIKVRDKISKKGQKQRIKRFLKPFKKDSNTYLEQTEKVTSKEVIR